MKAVSSREFSEWKVLFAEEDEEKHKTREKWEYYAAAIAYQIVRSNSTDPGKVKLEHYFFDYEKKSIESPAVLTEEQIKEKKRVASLASKMKWSAILKIPILKMDRDRWPPKTS